MFISKSKGGNVWKQILFSIICSVTFLSCDNELHMLFPEGPAGMSAYEVWVKEVLAGNIDWPEDRTDVNNFFLYLKGEDGKDGNDGKSAYELWKEEVARGLDNPHNPGHEWPKDQTDMNDFWYYLSGADGENGVTPNIGDNGNWWINGEDTGVPAQGKDGNDGNDGQPGTNGQSAYELWVEEVKAGRVYKNGELWPTNMTTVADFWEFLRGEDGKDGQDGQDGQDGATIVLGAPNVIIQYYGDPELKEYVDWEDGSVTYKIYDSNGKVAQKGTVVKGIPNSTSEYTTDAEGFITVPKEDLPKDKAYENIKVDVKISGEADFKNSANNTIVPAKMQVRLVVNESKTPTCGAFGEGVNLGKPCVNVWFKVQRKKLNTEGKGEWEGILAELGNTRRTVDIYEYANGTTNPTTTSTTNEIELSPGENNANYNNCKVQIKRKFIYTNLEGLNKTSVETSDDYWGEYKTGGFRYASIGIKGCYGENLMLQGYIKILPAQFAPTIKTLNRTSDIICGTGSSYIVALKGTLDVDNINEDIYLDEKYVQSGTEGSLPVYSPQKADIPSDKGVYQIRISWYTGGTNKTETAYVYRDGAFTTEDTNVTSKFILDGVSTESNFYEVNFGGLNLKEGKLYYYRSGQYVTSTGDNPIEVTKVQN